MLQVGETRQRGACGMLRRVRVEVRGITGRRPAGRSVGVRRRGVEKKEGAAFSAYAPRRRQAAVREPRARTPEGGVCAGAGGKKNPRQQKWACHGRT